MKKILAAALASALMVGLLAGCGTSSTKDSASPAESGSALASSLSGTVATDGSTSMEKVVGALGEAEGALRLGLGKLFAVAEAYPELRANENFMQLQQRITTLENGIADRRELYNDAVNINNVRIDQFPDAIIAHIFHFEAKPLLEFSSAEKSDVNLKQLFS